jgi:hypothetical protein
MPPDCRSSVLRVRLWPAADAFENSLLAQLRAASSHMDVFSINPQAQLIPTPVNKQVILGMICLLRSKWRSRRRLTVQCMLRRAAIPS